MIRVNILDDSDGYTYNLLFSDNDARRAMLDWGKQVITLESIGGTISVKNGRVSLSYRNGSAECTGQISCGYQYLINLLSDPENKFVGEEED